MNIPTLPVFDEIEEVEIGPPFSASASRLVIFSVAVIAARRIKDRFWDREVGAVRRIWAGSPRRLPGSSVVISLCLIANILMATAVSMQVLFTAVGGQSMLLFADENGFLALYGLFTLAQVAAAYLRTAPRTLTDFVLRLRHYPASSLRFPLFLDLVGLLCVLPILTVMAYSANANDSSDLSLGTIAFSMIVSTVAVMLPGRRREPRKTTGTTVDIVLKPRRRVSAHSDTGTGHQFPLNLVIRKISADNFAHENSINGLVRTPSDEDVDDKTRPSLIIKAEGCSPALLCRLRQMGDLKARDAAERRASLRSHRAHSSPNLTGTADTSVLTDVAV